MTFDTLEMPDDELAIWLAMQSLTGAGFGPKRILRLYERFGDIKLAWQATREQLIGQAYLSPDFADNYIAKRGNLNPEALLASVKKSGVRALPFTHPLYPPRLREIHDPPTVIFVSGDLKETDFNHVVGVVGTRSPSSYGQKLSKDMARGLSSNGCVVASGMAIGVDSLAHWGAIEGGGRTIAVVATGTDICYPSSNKRLYSTILDGKGIVISEYFPGTKAEKWHFPSRNRIVSGLSSALVVVEAGETSGSLITARLAFEQNREVFAIPGRVDAPMSIGTNRLIHDSIAHIARDFQDVLDGLQWVSSTIREVATVVELFGREKEIYELLSTEPTHFDVLCERTGMNAHELSASLTMLELAGLIARHPGDWYSRGQQGQIMYQQPTMPN